MNRLLSVFLLAAAPSLFLAAAPMAPLAPPSPIDLSIEIAPTSYGPYELLREQHPNTYTCTARLLDEPGHRVYGSVKLVLHPGEELTETTISGGLKMTMAGRVDSARTGADADVTVIRDGVLIAHQHSRVYLKGAGRSSLY